MRNKLCAPENYIRRSVNMGGRYIISRIHVYISDIIDIVIGRIINRDEHFFQGNSNVKRKTEKDK